MKNYIKLILFANITLFALVGCGSTAPTEAVVTEQTDEINATDDEVEIAEPAENEQVVSEEAQEADLTSEDDTAAEPKNFTVVIDPGHQLHQNSEKEASAPGSSVMKMKVTSGTAGVSSGKKEYEVTLDVALLLKDELEKKGYDVFLTRETDDVNISNQERAKYATEMNADIFIRLHCDGINDSSVRGATALVPTSNNNYIPQLADSSNKLAKSILDTYCSSTGIKSRGVKSGDDMTGINFSTVPVLILEMGFMSNPDEDLYMAQPDNQQLMAAGIAEGIENYYKEIGND